MAGKYGTEWTVFAFLILDAPWWAACNVESSLPLFIVAYGAESKLLNSFVIVPAYDIHLLYLALFAAAVLSAVCVEMGAVSRHIPGIGCKFSTDQSNVFCSQTRTDAHVYGAYNVAYGIGSSFGPIIAGQVRTSAKLSWRTVVNLTPCVFRFMATPITDGGCFASSGREWYWSVHYFRCASLVRDHCSPDCWVD